MDTFKISNEIPEIYTKCHEQFGVNWDDGVVFTYGDTIHCKYKLSPDLIIHESVHVKQQADMGKDEWWGKYFTDKEFRLSQEIAAYRLQIAFIKNNVKDRNEAFRMYHKIWNDMERMYGEMCTYKEARELTK